MFFVAFCLFFSKCRMREVSSFSFSFPYVPSRSRGGAKGASVASASRAWTRAAEFGRRVVAKAAAFKPDAAARAHVTADRFALRLCFSAHAGGGSVLARAHAAATCPDSGVGGAAAAALIRTSPASRASRSPQCRVGACGRARARLRRRRRRCARARGRRRGRWPASRRRETRREENESLHCRPYFSAFRVRGRAAHMAGPRRDTNKPPKKKVQTASWPFHDRNEGKES